ncbi:MAG TPA: hypothetical protein DIW47_15805 [Bacteroidetes bacterium]|nr:hypothetical protein [Bacteroidota bacterium]
MKKFLYSFLLLVSMSAGSGAQDYLSFSFVLLSSNQDTLQIGGLLAVTNSDSANAGVAFYHQYFANLNPGLRTLMLPIDSLYQGDSVSFYYEDCNGRHTYDTVFVRNQLLEITIQTGCQNPCDGSFNSYISSSKTGQFYANYYSSNYSHYWDFGNGQNTQGSSNVNTQYSSSGTYLVIHYLSNNKIGCYDSVGQYVTVYDSCYADFTYTMDSNTTVSYVGIHYPSTASGFWYFGDGYMDTGNTAMHTYPSKSNYTVSYVVEGGGCRDSVSKMVYVNTSQTCDSRFSVSHVADFQKRFVRTDSSYGYSKWYINNFFVGNGHSFIYTASQEGNYKVTLYVVDSANNVLCSHDDFFYLNFCGKPFAQAFAYGQVVFNGNVRMDYDSLKIYLISHDTAQGLLTLVDSAILTNADTGKFWFDICEPNQLFLVKAALLPGSSLYSSFIPTYYDSSLYWSGAKSFYGAGYLANGVINMIAGTNPGGPGFIGGHVTQGANKKDEPLEDIQVLLLTDQGIPVASVFTHDGGRFEFSNLAYGKYYLTVEFPGKNSATHFIILSADNETVDNKNFEVNSTYISALTSIVRIDKAVSGIYPNPANELLFIEWTGEADEYFALEFYGLDGKLVKATTLERKGEMVSELSIGDLPSGLYILKLSGAETNSTLRLQKN